MLLGFVRGAVAFALSLPLLVAGHASSLASAWVSLVWSFIHWTVAFPFRFWSMLFASSKESTGERDSSTSEEDEDEKLLDAATVARALRKSEMRSRRTRSSALRKRTARRSNAASADGEMLVPDNKDCAMQRKWSRASNKTSDNVVSLRRPSSSPVIDIVDTTIESRRTHAMISKLFALNTLCMMLVAFTVFPEQLSGDAKAASSASSSSSSPTTDEFFTKAMYCFLVLLMLAFRADFPFNLVVLFSCTFFQGYVLGRRSK